jgi:hypothetical protein
MLIIHPHRSSNYKTDQLSKSEWTSVLKLSSKLAMPKTRAWSITQLNWTLTYSEKAELGKEYGVASWVREGYIALVDQDRPIEESDWSRLGLATVVKLAEARESTYQSSFTTYRNSNPAPRPRVLPDYIETHLPELPPSDTATTPPDLVARIKVATDLKMPDVLRQAYISLVERPSSLTAEEAEQLGNTQALQIMQARMLLRKHPLVSNDYYRNRYHYSRPQEETTWAVVNRIFASELQRAQTLETEYLNPPKAPTASSQLAGESSGTGPKRSKKLGRPKGKK